MPAVPAGLSEWLALLTQPAVILVGVGLIVNQQNKRIDDLREDVKELRSEHRADSKALNEKGLTYLSAKALKPLARTCFCR